VADYLQAPGVAAMPDLRVPTISLPVEIRCVDGSAIAGEIFLPSHSSRQPGPMRPEEWTDTAPAFFPIRVHDTRSLTILNRDAVVTMTVPAGEAETVAGTPVSRVAIDAGGATFEGDIVIDMPPGHQRVADWLNAPGLFITLRAGLVHHLIQKRHVTRVLELDGPLA
jgi:hypothetical protein